MADKKNMHGKHGEDLLQFGAMVTPEFKAISQIAADLCGATLVDLITDGVKRIAEAKGVIDADGKVTPQYAPSVRLLANAYRQKLYAARVRAAAKKEDESK